MLGKAVNGIGREWAEHFVAVKGARGEAPEGRKFSDSGEREEAEELSHWVREGARRAR